MHLLLGKTLTPFDNLDDMEISGSTILTFLTRTPASHDSNEMSLLDIEKGIFLTQFTKLFWYSRCILQKEH